MEQHYQEVLSLNGKKDAVSYRPGSRDARPVTRGQQADNPNVRQLLRLSSTSPRRGEVSKTSRPLTSSSVTRSIYNPMSKWVDSTNASPIRLASEVSVKRNLTMKPQQVGSPEIIQRVFAGGEPTSPAKLHRRAEGSNLRDKFDQAKALDSELQKGDGVPEMCVLNDDDMPPIAEMDHLTRRCLCYLCTCSTHECPGDKYLNKYTASSAFTTIYKKDYKRKFLSNYNEARRTFEEYRSTCLPMELKTTNQVEYRPFKIEQVESAVSDIPQSNLRFTGKSFYSTEFPNWGPSYVEHEKEHFLPYRGKGLKLDVRTTYGSDFKGSRDQSRESAFASAGSASMYSTGPISVSNQFYGESISKSAYGKAHPNFSTYSYAAKQDYTPSECASSHFTSTYTNDFISKSPLKMWPKRPQL